MSNVLEISFKREFSDEFMQSLFSLCDTGIAYWATLDCTKDEEGTEFYDDAKKIVIGLNILESEERIAVLSADAAQSAKYETDRNLKLLSWRIDGLTFMKGIERIMSGEVEIRVDLFQNIVYAAIFEDDSRLDPECVDTIVQVGLYNELVWG